ELLGGVVRDDVARPAADLRPDDGGLVTRPDELVQHGDRIVAQLEADVERHLDAHPFARDRVAGLVDRLEPQVVEVELVPRPDDMEAFLANLARIEHRAAPDQAPALDADAAEAFPQHADVPG